MISTIQMRGVRLSEIQQPTSAATVSVVLSGLVSLLLPIPSFSLPPPPPRPISPHFSPSPSLPPPYPPPPPLSGCRVGLAFLPAWPHLWLHVLWLSGGHASEADSGCQHSQDTRNEGNHRVCLSTSCFTSCVTSCCFPQVSLC